MNLCSDGLQTHSHRHRHNTSYSLFPVKDRSSLLFLSLSIHAWSLFVTLFFSVHIIMSGRQISTTAIVGPSVYLPTRKDSLCYNRLISLPPRTLISSQLKIETIKAVGGVTLLALWHVHFSQPPHSHTPTPPPQIAAWPWQVQSAVVCTDLEGWQPDRLSWDITVSSLTPDFYLLKRLMCFTCLCKSVFVHVLNWAYRGRSNVCKRRGMKKKVL